MNYWISEIPKNISGVDLKTFLNKKRILKNLYKHGVLSGSEIATILNVSLPTSNAYLSELVEEGFVKVKGKGGSIGGRKPVIYKIKEKSVFLIAIDIARDLIRVALFDSTMQRVDEKAISIRELTDKTFIVNSTSDTVFDLLDQNNVTIDKIMGIGINLPGLVDSEKKINYTYLYDEKESLAESFEKVFNRPVFIENDSKSRAIAEQKYGSAKDCNNALVIQIDHGLGMGMILDGRLYKGATGFSGEFSHIPVVENGVLCSCGKTGCLETIASGNALVRMAAAGLKNNKKSTLYNNYIAGEPLKDSAIIDAALAGDQFALSLIKDVGEALGQGISYLVQILNPELIVLDGELSRAKEYLITSIKQSMFAICLPRLHENVRITTSTLGNDIGIIGAAVVAIENILCINDE